MWRWYSAPGISARPDMMLSTGAMPVPIMRRILKRIASGDIEELGDTTTLSDPDVVEKLVTERV